MNDAELRQARRLAQKRDKSAQNINTLIDLVPSLVEEIERMRADRDAATAKAAARGIVAGLRTAEEDKAELLRTVQRESALVNERDGVIAHLVGVLAEVHRAKTIEDAKTFAEIALGNIEEWHRDAWKPGPHDDAADWKPGHHRENGGA